ncbi:3'-5' exonuclease [Haemophilus pittmaniae HK 85]|nr:3'-5' exonuclease [Haemophilus pittmaniae HK 85]
MIKEVQTAAPYVLIENDQALAECCWQAMQQSVVALDTEFVRVSSYYPHLGLIQLYDGNQVSLIDPLCISDFGPFVELLTAPAVTKVLHACSEDLLVFLQEFDVLPEPMLDTQIMARF